VRFELTSPCELAVFKTAPFDRSGTPPRRLCTGDRGSVLEAEPVQPRSALGEQGDGDDRTDDNRTRDEQEP
jgi:hypothetical protein